MKRRRLLTSEGHLNKQQLEKLEKLEDDSQKLKQPKKRKKKIWPGKNKKRKYPCGSFCNLPSPLLESKAYFELSGEAAHRCLIRFYQKIKRVKTKRKGTKQYQGANLKEIIFTFNEAMEFGGIPETTFNRVINQLLNKGFIDIVEPGNWYHKKPNVYGISDRWRMYGTPNYREPKTPNIIPDKW